MSKVEKLAVYTMEHTRVYRSEVPENAPSVVDCYFVKVIVDETFDKDLFKALLEDALSGEGHGIFQAITRERMEMGPSYIEIGAWIGDQTIALQLMAAGEVAGVWRVMTPKVLGFKGADADMMAGKGMVMAAGMKPL